MMCPLYPWGPHCICMLFFGDPLLFHCFSFPWCARCSLWVLSFAQDPVFTPNQHYPYPELISVLPSMIKNLFLEVNPKLTSKTKFISAPHPYLWRTTKVPPSKTSRKQRASPYLSSTTIVPLFSKWAPMLYSLKTKRTYIFSKCYL